MTSKFLVWRLLLAVFLIAIVILAGSYGAGFVSSQSVDLKVYIPVAGNIDGGSGEEEPTPEPTSEPTPEPTSEPTPDPTQEPTPDPTQEPLPQENVFYISPTGNDASDGTTESKAWATFDRAWESLYPGDTLIILDGVYYQSLIPGVRNGTKENPITIRAQNDGKAILDGNFERSPVVRLGSTFGGESGENPVGHYFIIEGIVARNAGTDDQGHLVIIRKGNGNVLRRISAYDAHTDTNSGVIKITGDYNLVEDCVAAGTGRKMIYINGGEHNIIRRCLADWRGHDSRLWPDCWPWGDGIEIYNASNNIIENSISYSRNPTYAISLMAQGVAQVIGNKVLGSIAILAGMKEDGVTSMLPEWVGPRPGPTKHTCMRDFDWSTMTSGFRVYEGSTQVSGNLWQDILAWGNAGLGLGWASGGQSHPGTGDNHINRATLFHNALDHSDKRANGGDFIDTRQKDLEKFESVTNSFIETIYVDWPNYPTGPRNLTTMNGEGARLTHRYIDGVLTDEPLWPWPMEDRIQAELGYSITSIMDNIFSQMP